MTDAPRFDWAARYAAADTPWDLGRAHPELERRLASGELAPDGPGRRALVAGCGSGHDAEALARAGWEVTAVDVVPELEAPLRARLAPHGGTVVIGDALELDLGAPFDLVWEHTFLCALHPEQRPDWVACVRRHVAPAGGRLAGVCFPLGKPAEEGGPPFGWTPEELFERLGPAFRVETEAVSEPGSPRRTWPERYLLLVRD